MTMAKREVDNIWTQVRADMTKTLKVEGMMCAHCVAHVEKALTALGGVTSAKADLEGKCATVTLAAPVTDQELKDAVTQAGYEVVSVREG